MFVTTDADAMCFSEKQNATAEDGHIWSPRCLPSSKSRVFDVNY